MATSSIEWTEMTWNPVTGCNKISAGCKFCYAETMSKRLKAMGIEKYQNGFKVTLHPETLKDPFKWKRPKVVFVNSMSDLFHEEVPLEFIQQVFEVMNNNPHHTFQVLTKRAENVLKYDRFLNWTPNIWMGVSIENTKVIDRSELLALTSAHIKFLSVEPLLGPIKALPLTNIDWVIVGGESGPGARPMKEDWVVDILDQCQTKEIKFFFKQWGGVQKKKAGRLLLGQTWDELPNLANDAVLVS